MISSTKHILVPTDFSVCAKKAALAAGSIANKLHAKITLLNVIDPPFNFPTNMEGVIDYLRENAEQHLDRLSTDLKETYPDGNITVKKQIRIGKPVSQILEGISDLHIDLVITGSGSDSPARKVVFGSVSTETIMHSPIPIISIPENSNNVSFEKLLFTTNFRSNDLNHLKNLIDLAKIYQSEIDVLHISATDELEADIKLRGFKELIFEQKLYNNISFKNKIHEDPFAAISEYIEDNETTMLVLNRYKKSVVGLLMDKNYTKQLGIYSKVPLLVLN